jgi:hypothetical protein
MRLPSGLNAALRTASSWPRSGSRIASLTGARQVHPAKSADANRTMQILPKKPEFPVSAAPKSEIFSSLLEWKSAAVYCAR